MSVCDTAKRLIEACHNGAVSGLMIETPDLLALCDSALAGLETGSPIRRATAQPNRATFSIQPIRDWIYPFSTSLLRSVDPFARNAKLARITNDLDHETSARHHLDAREFLKQLVSDGERADLVFFDPPYSPRQVKECYGRIGRSVGQTDTQNARLYRECRELIDEIVIPGGVVLSFGWNSVGMGTGWNRISTLLVCHGGAHNDTICVADRKP